MVANRYLQDLRRSLCYLGSDFRVSGWSAWYYDGTDTVEMHTDAVAPGERVLIVDDLVATGGTCAATVQLVRDAGAEVVAWAKAFLDEAYWTVELRD